LLVLPGLELTQKRLMVEQEKALKAFRPEIIQRFHLVLVERGEYINLPARFSSSDKMRLDQLIKEQTVRYGERLPRIDGYYVILKLLVFQWLKNEPPVTAKWLSDKSGYSYPTVAKALTRLADGIKKHSDRRIELKSFPRDEWARLLAVSDQVRSTTRFIDVSGQPRPAGALMRRLRETGRSDIAIGGVHGARRYYPELDLVGSPRLDLIVHCPLGAVNLDFVNRLDPGLARVEGAGKPAHLAVHVVRSRDSFFEKGKDDLFWADPVECLLDLHDERLEPQALEFLNNLVEHREKNR